MPLFDYLCTECGKTSELLVSASTPNAVQCPDCGGANMKKLLSAHSSLSGAAKNSLPGAGDTGCCGTSPTHASCAN